jgi:hypothetical protein
MEVAIRVRRAIVIYHDVNTFNIDPAPENVCGDQYALLKRLESCIPADAVQ